MTFTAHFLHRAATRGLRPDVFWFVLTYGVERACSGARFVTVRDRDLPPDADRDLADRARGWVVVLGDDGEAVTCYRRRAATRFIARRLKHAA